MVVRIRSARDQFPMLRVDPANIAKDGARSLAGSATIELEKELDAAGDGLLGNSEVLRSVLAGSGDCIKIIDLSGRLQFMSEGGKRVMEVEDFGKLKGCPWPDFWAGEGNGKAKDALNAALAGRSAHFTGAADTAAGTPKYWDVHVSPIFGNDGKPAHILSISRDITEEHKAKLALEEAAATQKILMHELQHRIKNTLTTVSAIATQTFSGESLAGARQAFVSRMIILGHAHDILTRTSWDVAPIRKIVEAALAPHQNSKTQVFLKGDDVELAPRQALSLAMAIHELATNALKYGALSVEQGTVQVEWANSEVGFSLTWQEIGGPPVTAPTREMLGFGSRLIEKIMAADFGGKVEIRYLPEGVRCELRSPDRIASSIGAA